MQCSGVAILALLSVAFVVGDVGYGPGEQKWGYVTVRDGAHMFYWLYYTSAEVENFIDRPLLIWLEGGPGLSATGFSNFVQIGPLDADLNPRNYTWVKDANVLFIDNPVGTGFSYVDDISLLTTTNAEIAADLVVFLRGFLDEFPEFKIVPLYILSESYGAKMAIEFAYEIERAVADNSLDVQLIGVELGDSWISPIDSMLTYASYLFHIGAIDQQGKEKVASSAKAIADAVAAGQWNIATDLSNQIGGVINQLTFGIDFYNVLKRIREPSRSKPFKLDFRDEIDDRIKAIMNGPVRSALKLNVTYGDQTEAIYYALYSDIMKPVVHIVERVLNETNIIVSVASGQLDLIVDTPGTLKWVDEMSWWGKNDWEQAERTVITKDGYNEGYVKYAQNLRFYWVNRAGHFVPFDNPAAMDIILRQLTADYGKMVAKRNFHE